MTPGGEGCVFSLATLCHRHTLPSQTKGHLDNEGSGACLIWGKAERAGTVQLTPSPVEYFVLVTSGLVASSSPTGARFLSHSVG